MNRLAGIMIFMLLSFNAFAGYGPSNPGVSAEDCVSVSASESSGNLTIKNTCSEKVFVVWCASMPRDMERYSCGPKAGNSRFYTETLNLNAGGEVTWNLTGEFHYAACKGLVPAGESTAQYYADDGKGGFQCKRTGDSARINLKEDTSAADQAARDKAAAAADKKSQAEQERIYQAEKKAEAAKAKAKEAAAEDKHRANCMARRDLSDCDCIKYSPNKGTACRK